MGAFVVANVHRLVSPFIEHLVWLLPETVTVFRGTTNPRRQLHGFFIGTGQKNSHRISNVNKAVRKDTPKLTKAHSPFVAAYTGGDHALLNVRIGEIHVSTHNFTDALSHFKSALSLLDETGNRSSDIGARALFDLANVQQRLGQYDNALLNYVSALHIYEKDDGAVTNASNAVPILVGMANTYSA